MKITFPNTISEGYRVIRFKEPLVIECYGISDDGNYAFIEFDFGMQGEIGLTREKNCILYGHETENVEQKIIRDISFDLFHAFFHPNIDPNYSYYHWALYGMLKDKVECDEKDDELMEDIEHDKI